MPGNSSSQAVREREFTWGSAFIKTALESFLYANQQRPIVHRFALEAEGPGPLWMLPSYSPQPAHQPQDASVPNCTAICIAQIDLMWARENAATGGMPIVEETIECAPPVEGGRDKWSKGSQRPRLL